MSYLLNFPDEAPAMTREAAIELAKTWLAEYRATGIESKVLVVYRGPDQRPKMTAVPPGRKVV